jgi:hypothetical protein
MSSKSKRESSNLSLLPLFGEEHKRVPALGPEIVFWTRTKKPRVPPTKTNDVQYTRESAMTFSIPGLLIT